MSEIFGIFFKLVGVLIVVIAPIFAFTMRRFPTQMGMSILYLDRSEMKSRPIAWLPLTKIYSADILTMFWLVVFAPLHAKRSPYCHLVPIKRTRRWSLRPGPEYVLNPIRRYLSMMVGRKWIDEAIRAERRPEEPGKEQHFVYALAYEPSDGGMRCLRVIIVLEDLAHRVNDNPGLFDAHAQISGSGGTSTVRPETFRSLCAAVKNGPRATRAADISYWQRCAMVA